MTGGTLSAGIAGQVFFMLRNSHVVALAAELSGGRGLAVIVGPAQVVGIAAGAMDIMAGGALHLAVGIQHARGQAARINQMAILRRQGRIVNEGNRMGSRQGAHFRSDSETVLRRHLGIRAIVARQAKLTAAIGRGNLSLECGAAVHIKGRNSGGVPRGHGAYIGLSPPADVTHGTAQTRVAAVSTQSGAAKVGAQSDQDQSHRNKQREGPWPGLMHECLQQFVGLMD